MQVSGTVKLIKETVTVGAKGFQKRDIIVTTDEQFPQHISVQFTQDKCALLDNFSIGSLVTININLRGREWINPQGESVYFNTIQGWTIVENKPVAPEPYNEPPQDLHNQDEPDGLPF